MSTLLRTALGAPRPRLASAACTCTCTRAASSSASKYTLPNGLELKGTVIAAGKMAQTVSVQVERRMTDHKTLKARREPGEVRLERTPPANPDTHTHTGVLEAYKVPRTRPRQRLRRRRPSPRPLSSLSLHLVTRPRSLSTTPRRRSATADPSRPGNASNSYKSQRAPASESRATTHLRAEHLLPLRQHEPNLLLVLYYPLATPPPPHCTRLRSQTRQRELTRRKGNGSVLERREKNSRRDRENPRTGQGRYTPKGHAGYMTLCCSTATLSLSLSTPERNNKRTSRFVTAFLGSETSQALLLLFRNRTSSVRSTDLRRRSEAL